jgi:hypothetical protein
MTEQPHSPNLQRLRDWYFDKVILQDAAGAAFVHDLAEQMLAGTAQAQLSGVDRDPNFSNSQFQLTARDWQQMLQDEGAARAVRKPTFPQLEQWETAPGMLEVRYRRIQQYQVTLAKGAFLLSRLELIAMQAAQEFVLANDRSLPLQVLASSQAELN